MGDSLRDRAAAAIEAAKSAGAQGVWAAAARTRSVDFSARDGKLENVKESTSRGLSIGVYVDGRFGTHRTTSLGPERLSSFIAEAVAMTRALEQDPNRDLPDPTLFAGRPESDLELVDPGRESVDHAVREAWVLELEARAHADPRVISAEAGCYDGWTEGAALSSHGFDGAWANTSWWWGATATVKDEGDRKPAGSHWVGARRVEDLPSRDEIAAEALRKATLRLGSIKGPSQSTRLVVDRRAGGRLIGMLLGPASGQAIQQGRSFWSGQRGQKLFGERLTLIDDPVIRRGLGSRYFDGEGIAARRRPIVEAGVVRDYYFDTYYARKLGEKPTSGEQSNVVVAPGDAGDLDAILKTVGAGIYVTSWLGGNADGTTGDFSLGLRGHLIDKGTIGPPIGEMNVTGNLRSLFGRLALVGSDPWPYRRVRVPTLVFDDVQFSGA